MVYKINVPLPNGKKLSTYCFIVSESQLTDNVVSEIRNMVYNRAVKANKHCIEIGDLPLCSDDYFVIDYDNRHDHVRLVRKV